MRFILPLITLSRLYHPIAPSLLLNRIPLLRITYFASKLKFLQDALLYARPLIFTGSSVDSSEFNCSVFYMLLLSSEFEDSPRHFTQVFWCIKGNLLSVFQNADFVCQCLSLFQMLSRNQY
jgi:hypothetical protein